MCNCVLTNKNATNDYNGSPSLKSDKIKKCENELRVRASVRKRLAYALGHITREQRATPQRRM